MLRGGAQQRPDVVGALRPSEQVALAERAAELDELTALVIVLDALGDRAEVERARKTDDRLHETRGTVLAADLVDERLRDLEDVDREPLQVAERRVAGAEVVDGDAHAEVPQLVEPRDHGDRARPSAPLSVISRIRSSAARPVLGERARDSLDEPGSGAGGRRC